jgi:hypothetical protein
MSLFRWVAPLFLTAMPAVAGLLSLSPSNVIGGSIPYGGNWQSGSFNATLILNQQTGAVSDAFGSSYWLNPDGGRADAYIVIDLGATYQVTSLDLFNTHNSNYGDRGTGNFQIRAGNSVVDLGGPGFDLTGSTTVILNGTLVAAPVVDPIAGQSFSVSDTNGYRYLRFEPLSVATANTSCCGANNYGLNELRVFGAEASAPQSTPEPAAFVLMGSALVAISLIRRRR